MEFLKEWQAWIFGIIAVLATILRSEYKIKIIEKENEFNKESIIKLNMDSREQFKGIKNAMDKIENSVYMMGCKIESSISQLASVVNKLEGVVSEMRRGK